MFVYIKIVCFPLLPQIFVFLHHPSHVTGTMGTRLPVHRNTGTPGHLDTKTTGHWDTRLLGHRDTKTQRHMDTKKLGHLDYWMMGGVGVPTFSNIVLILARAVGIPVGRHSGDQLATTLVATINNIIFFSPLSNFLIEGVL